MKFGKLESINEVDFSLPDDHPSGLKLKQLAGAPNPKLYVGCTAWNIKEWKGQVYPGKAKPPQFLFYYGEQFNCIELNSFYYRIPDKETILTWCQSVPDDFRFCPKLPQTISHRESLGVESGQVDKCKEALKLFGHKIGTSFLQLPKSFENSQFDELKTFIETFGSEYRLCVEFRHESWFSDAEFFASVVEFLKSHETGLVITDVAGRRDVCHMAITNKFCHIRFVGNDLDGTDYHRIHLWLSRMIEWFNKGMEEIFFFIHEPDNTNAPVLCAYLIEQLSSQPEIQIRGPQLQINNQMDIF